MSMLMPPSVSSFPTPVPAFPAPTPTGYFGLTPDEAQLQSLIPTLGQAPTVVGAPGVPAFSNSLTYLAKLTNGALGPDNDPATWTPDEAAAQTDRALARIAQANPELATTLAEQQGRSAEQGEDLPWYKDILKGVGDFMDVTGLDTVFDYLGRASHVLPEVVHDWGKESVWKNMGDALSGNSDTNWADVLVDNFGMERNWLTAVAGLAGDIATDPLTWLTFGAGAMGRAAVGRTLSEAGVSAALKKGMLTSYKGATHDLDGLLKDVLSRLGPNATIDDAARAIIAQADAGTSLAAKGASLLDRTKNALKGVHPDAKPGALFTVEEMANNLALRETIRFADDLYRAGTTTGWQRVSAEAAAKMGVDKGLVDDVLRGYVSAGTGVGVTKPMYTLGKAAAANLGGVRLRFSIPVLDIRMAGLRLPLIPARMDFSMGRRFFSGLSGNTKLMKMVGKGQASMEDMRIFWEQGWEGLRKYSPRVYKEMGGPVSSIFYSASEGLGKFTSHFSRQATVLRGGGLAAKYANEVSTQSRHVIQQATDEIQTVTLRDGTVSLPKATIDRVAKATSTAGERAPELTDLLNEYRKLVPDAGRDAAEYYDELIAAHNLRARKLGTEGTPDSKAALDDLRKDKARAVEVEKGVLEIGGDDQLGDVWRAVQANKEQALLNAGLKPDLFNERIVIVDDMVPEEALLHSDGLKYRAPTVTSSDPIGVPQLTDGPEWLPIRGLEADEVGPIDNMPGGGAKPDVPDDGPTVGTAVGGDTIGASRLTEAEEQAAQMDSVWAQASTKTDEEIAAELGQAPVYLDVVDDGDNIVITTAEGSEVSGAWDGDDIIITGAEVVKEQRRRGVGTRAYQSLADLADRKGGVLKSDITRTEEAEKFWQGLQAKGFDVEYDDAAGRWIMKPGMKPPQPSTDPYTNMKNNLLEEHQRQLLAHNTMNGLDDAEKAYVTDPQIVFTGPRRTLDVDYTRKSPSTASEAVDPVKEIHDTYGPILDDINEGTYDFGDLPEDVQEVLKDAIGREGGKQQQLADITTKLLKARGYTDVRIRYVDEATGEVRTKVISFFDDTTGTVAAARINPQAARLGVKGGQMRAITQDVREAVMGVKPKKGDRLLNKIERKVANMSRDEAEKTAQRMLRKAGIKLREGQKFFEDDALRVLELSTKEAAGRVGKQFIGEAARSAENLGFTRGGFGGQSVGLGRYRVVLHENGVKWAKGMSKELRKAQETASRIADQKIPQLRAVADDLNRQALEAESDLTDLIENGSSREAAILNDIGLQLDPGVDRTFSPEGIRTSLAARQADFGRLINGEVPPGDAFERVTDNIFMQEGASGLRTYYYVENGRVLGTREVLKAQMGQTELGRQVTTFVDPDMQGRGIGFKLLDADWTKRGVYEGTPQQQLDNMAEAALSNKRSEAGMLLNKAAVRKAVKRLRGQTKNKADNLKTAAEKARRDLERMRDGEQVQAINALNDIEYRMAHDRAPILAALVPADDAMNMTGMVQLRIPGFEKMAMPAHMAEEFEFAMRGYPKLDGAHAAFRQFNSWWKSMATWIMPGFHIRNLEGAFFNNWLGGVTIRDYITSGRIRRAERELAKGEAGKWAKARVVEVDPDMADTLRLSAPGGHIMGVPIDELTYADLARLSSGLNLTASNGRLFAEAQLTIEAEARKYKGGGKKAYIQRIPGPYTRFMRGVGTGTENVMRTAAFVRGLRDGRSIMESRGFAMMRHGDYEDMTDWEYKFIRDLIPFYKWMRTNTPFQIHQLLENPARLLAVSKGQQALYEAQGLEYDEEAHRMPHWMTQGLTIPFNVSEEDGLTTYDTVMLDLPMADMFMSGREFVASFLPTVRPFLESYIFEQQTFSGSPLTGRMKPLNTELLPGVLKPLNPLLNSTIGPLLEVTGLAERGEDDTLYISDKNSNLMGMLPIYSRFKNWIYADEDSASKRSNMVASAFAGFQLRPVDMETLSDTELSFYYDQVLPTMQYLKDIGYPLPTTAELADIGKTTDGILAGLGITPGPVSAAA